MAEYTLAGQAKHYRREAAAVERRLDAKARYRGRIKDVRTRDLWVRLADEIDGYLVFVADEDERIRTGVTDDDVALF